MTHRDRNEWEGEIAKTCKRNIFKTEKEGKGKTSVLLLVALSLSTVPLFQWNRQIKHPTRNRQSDKTHSPIYIVMKRERMNWRVRASERTEVYGTVTFSSANLDLLLMRWSVQDWCETSAPKGSILFGQYGLKSILDLHNRSDRQASHIGISIY